MATVFSPFQNANQTDDDKDKQGGLSAQVSNPLVSSGSSAFTSASQPQGPVTANSAGQTNSQLKPTSSGRFINIQNYLNANKDSGQNLANRVGGTIEQNAKGVASSIRGARDLFEAQSNQGRLERDSSLNRVNQILSNPGANVYGDGTQANEDIIRGFQRISSGQYRGPQALADIGGLTSKAQSAKQEGNLAGSESGRFSLLRQMFGKPSYTRGQTKFDELLLGQNAQPLNQARQVTSALPRMASQNIEEAHRLADFYTKEARDVGQQATERVLKQANEAENMLTKKFEQIDSDERSRREMYERLVSDLSQGQIHRDDVKRLGLKMEGDELRLFGVDPRKFIDTKLAPVAVNKNTVATRDEVALLNALKRLAGEQEALDFSKANTFTASQQNVDPAIYDAIERGRKEFEAAERRKQEIIKQFNDSRNSLMNLTSGIRPGNNVGDKEYEKAVRDKVTQLFNSGYVDALADTAQYAPGHANTNLANKLGNDFRSLGIEGLTQSIVRGDSNLADPSNRTWMQDFNDPGRSIWGVGALARRDQQLSPVEARLAALSNMLRVRG